MTPFDFPAAITARPAGDTTAQLVAAYGDPLKGSVPDSRTRGWFIPNKAWREANLVYLPTSEFPGFPPFGTQHVKGFYLHKRVAPVFRATWAELAARGLNHRLRTFSGSFAPRHMGHDPKRPPSVHAFAAAIDFDAAWNGYGVPKSRMEIDREVVRCFQECGWEWGGEWSSPWQDGMHFQWTDGLKGVQQPEWRDALKKPPAPIVDTTVPPAKVPERPIYIWTQVQNPDGTLRPGEVVSVPVDKAGRLLVQANGKPKIVRVPEHRLMEGEY